MKKVRAAIVGYGNIGHYVLEALQAAPDFEIAGVVRRAGAENKPEELANYAVVKGYKRVGRRRSCHPLYSDPQKGFYIFALLTIGLILWAIFNLLIVIN